MSIDRRFPWMVSLDDRRVSPPARRAVRSICERTNCRAVYDTRDNSAHFYLGSNMAFGVSTCLLGGPWDSGREDAQVRHILRGRMPAALKDREMALAEQEAEYERQNEIERITGDMRPDLERQAKRGLEKASMGRHWKGSALVNGSK